MQYKIKWEQLDNNKWSKKDRAVKSDSEFFYLLSYLDLDRRLSHNIKHISYRELSKKEIEQIKGING